MEILKFETMEQFNDQYLFTLAQARWRETQKISQEHKDQKIWSKEGYCQCCEKETDFLFDWEYSDGEEVNFRERIICTSCGLNNRQRFMLSYLKNLAKTETILSIYSYEQVTPFYKHLVKVFGQNCIGSEFLDPNLDSGTMINGIRHEDAMHLSFKDKSFDAVISNDVFEHVTDLRLAILEAWRVLKNGGKLIFSVPFYHDRYETRQRAFLKGEEIIHLDQPQYHGNPVSAEGCLVFSDIGWDLLDLCKEVGFQTAYMLVYYSKCYGHPGPLNYLFIAEKNGIRKKFWSLLNCKFRKVTNEQWLH